MRSKWVLTCLVAALLTGCSAPWSSEPEPQAVIVPDDAPPVEDRKASRQAAGDFREEAAEFPFMYTLGKDVKDVYGDWEDGGTRAFVSTGLAGHKATKENGKRLANAFADWRNSENGTSKVIVYGRDGKLLYHGAF